MLTLREFQEMDEDQKLCLIWDNQMLAKRLSEGLEVALYSVGCFYVEAYFNTETKEIVAVHAFDRVNLLAPYLEQINFNIKPDGDNKI